MPPSGYSKEQSRHLTEMLTSCASALVEEARGNRWTLLVALDSELTNIKRYVKSELTTEAQRSILELTAVFYGLVRDASPSNADDFWLAVDRASRALESEMLAIKIPSLA